MARRRLRNAATIAAFLAALFFTLAALPKPVAQAGLPKAGALAGAVPMRTVFSVPASEHATDEPFALRAFRQSGGTQANTQSGAVPSGDVRVLFEAANRERNAAGVAALGWDAALARAARSHAELLAKGVTFAHQLPGEPNLAERAGAAGAHFSYIAENIAAGEDAESLHVGWMHSPGHRSNLLSPRVNMVGIAVAARGERLYAVEDFARVVPELSLAEQETKVSALLASSGWQISSAYAADARRVCAGGTPPRLNTSFATLQFEASDLDQLPPGVARDLRSRRAGRASVGACASGNNGGFTHYRLAVLLY